LPNALKEHPGGLNAFKYNKTDSLFGLMHGIGKIAFSNGPEARCSALMQMCQPLGTNATGAYLLCAKRFVKRSHFL
jgi:hypothetical protein